MSPDQTEAPSGLSVENKAMIKQNCSALRNLVAGKTLGELIKVREEANPPMTLALDERGVEEALREKIRRPRGRILPIDYERVGVMNMPYNFTSQEGFKGSNLDFLVDFSNLTRIYVAGSNFLKDIEGLTRLPNLEYLSIQCRKADFKPLIRLKTLKGLTTQKYDLPFLINNKSLKQLKLNIGGGGPLPLIAKGEIVPELDFSLLIAFPDLEKFSLSWNSVYKSKDFEVLIKLKKQFKE